MSNKIALVLAGGGAKGDFQVGFLDELHKAGVEFDVVSGVSVGALNGAMVASNKIPELVELWDGITADDIYKKNSMFKLFAKYVLHKIGIHKAPFGTYSNEPLFELIKRELDYDDIVKPFYAGRVNINTKGYEYELDRKNFHKQILASTAIPIVWEPTMIDGNLYVDGGVRNITPLGDVLQHEPDTVITVTTEPYSDHNFTSPEYTRKKAKQQLMDILDVGKNVLNILLNEVFQNDVNHFQVLNEMARQAEAHGVELTRADGKPVKYFDHIFVAPERGLGSALDFDRPDRNVHGRELAERVLQEQGELLTG